MVCVDFMKVYIYTYIYTYIYIYIYYVYIYIYQGRSKHGTACQTRVPQHGPTRYLQARTATCPTRPDTSTCPTRPTRQHVQHASMPTCPTRQSAQHACTNTNTRATNTKRTNQHGHVGEVTRPLQHGAALLKG